MVAMKLMHALLFWAKVVEVEPTSIMGSTNIEDEYGRHTYHKVPNHLSPFMNASAMVIAVAIDALKSIVYTVVLILEVDELGKRKHCISATIKDKRVRNHVYYHIRSWSFLHFLTSATDLQISSISQVDRFYYKRFAEDVQVRLRIW